ncbi:MAG: FecR domain-containing protein [Thermoguttaceae bacterium]
METELVARITEMRNCQWSTAEPAPDEAEQLRVGQQLQLEKGLVQITYFNKALVLLEGPVSYTVDSPKSGFLSRGKLTARAETEQSRQFTILTPNARFVDMGTEFGVALEANGRAAIAVFAGKVKAEAKKADGGWNTQVSLKEGQAGVYERSKFIPQVCIRSDFPTLQLAPPPPTSYQRWLEASRELQSRRDLLAYYDFQPDPNDTKVLLNRSPSGAKFNGEIQNAAWAPGRFDGKSALEFTAEDAGVRVNVDDKLEQISLVTWVNINKLANGLNGLLLTNDWSRPGQLHWEINSDKHIDLGEFMFNGFKNTVIFQSKEAIPDNCFNQWCMISGVIDRMNKCCLMYINNKCVLTQSFEQISIIKTESVGHRQLSDRSNDSQLPVIEIGSATIAGWLESGKDPSPNKVRSLNCRMDELMIFKSALSAEEIQKIYEAGKP